ncbi:MAG: DUF177 domain-containing protein [Deltaproteobacteria bacterium]|nr:DUF177 domain-containing protein [Deltaproteobacteria bacterium]
MKVQLHDILAVPTAIAYAESVDQLNATLRESHCPDYAFTAPLDVDITCSRSLLDLFFDGRVRGVATATCARCLAPFPLEITKDFSLVLTPEEPLRGEIELAAGDLAESFYSGTEVDVTRLVYEQVLLALPTRPLCDEECRGLCPQCGVNRNTTECSCTVDSGDPRLAVLRGLKIGGGA